jgi:hypothetical protein
LTFLIHARLPFGASWAVPEAPPILDVSANARSSPFYFRHGFIFDREPQLPLLYVVISCVSCLLRRQDDGYNNAGEADIHFELFGGELG